MRYSWDEDKNRANVAKRGMASKTPSVFSKGRWFVKMRAELTPEQADYQSAAG
jgi:uncharacterized DUF497 family protein